MEKQVIQLTKFISLRSWARAIKAAFWDIEQLGLAGAAKLALAQAATILMKDFGLKRRSVSLTIKPIALSHPVRLRMFGSDVYTVRQVLVEREHQPLDDVGDVKFIVDCGANIGCSAAYFLSVHPNAKLVAVEPDASNFEVLQKNLAVYGNRARCIRAAIWDADDIPLRTKRGTDRDGLEWATTVEACDRASQDTIGVTLQQILGESGQEFIDILKIDIEGGEERLFLGETQSCLAHTRNLCIELHSPECECALRAVLDRYDFDEIESKELRIYRGLRLKRTLSPGACGES
jgi:FkbM family methyltransferase